MMNHRTKGASGARNTGIFDAKGKWIAFLDDDDVWLPDKLKYQYEKAKNSNSSIGLISTDYAIIRDKQRKPAIFRNRSSGWVLDKFLDGYSIGCLSSVAIRSDILKKLDGFDERFPSSQDWDLWLRTAEICQVTYVPKMLVIMYQEIRSDRIGQNYVAKLAGHMLLRNKFSNLINRNPRLRHRHESLILTFAILEGNKHLVLKCLPWFLMGLCIDPVNFVRTIRSVIIFCFRKNF
jgi:glycosyltransferase involved in cell wall biosynthesis